MRVQIFSDSHIDVAPTKPIKIGADVDVVVVAGDTAEGARNAFEAFAAFRAGAGPGRNDENNSGILS